MPVKSRSEHQNRGFSISRIFIILGSFIGNDLVKNIYPAIKDNLFLNFVIFVSIYIGLRFIAKGVQKLNCDYCRKI